MIPRMAGFLPISLPVSFEPYIWLLICSTSKCWDVLEFCAVCMCLSFCCLLCLLDQGSTNIFLKGQIENILGLVGYMVPVSTTQLCWCSQKAAMWLCPTSSSLLTSALLSVFPISINTTTSQPLLKL